MLSYISGRFVSLILTTLAASVIVFLLMQVLPGDPAAVMLGINAQPETLAALQKQLGLDAPLWSRYLTWISGFVVGDFGVSYTYSVPISELLGPRILVTLPLAVLAMSISVILAIPLGVIAASKRGKAFDVAGMGVAQVGVAIPNFWLGLLLILLFALQLGWFPASGFGGWEDGLWKGLRSLILPAVALALPLAAILARVTRSAVIETLGEDFIRTARAKGLTRSHALWKHAVPNALIPVVTIIGLQFSFLLAGTIIIENVFNLPGVGRLIFQSIAQRDLITVQSLVTLLAASVITVNFLVDLAYGFLDPRLSTGGH
ncbi:peptide/nickel transport system permease protein [Paenochrobactrum gallinarii]|uniref:Peptide/nickel transport system permease protein n=1 Tax=Paenochrobactrum gallinarii TaxID=643673 RepID=A0A841LUF9_9HYPH|nr:ABC transporter permease [Paenochrobactrum gallinarii]MBB6260926.1 peptide/nickel transport system permease protein [Paenochrobactrum gallinarii]